MEVIQDVNIMREKLKRLGSHSIGVVQAKSFLHKGHSSLIEAARKENYVVIAVKLIVPAEFVSREAADLYPSNVDEEMILAARAGADFFFMPSIESIYPNGSITKLRFCSEMTTKLNGLQQPSYYEERLTTTCILLNMLSPKRLYMSDKDPQLLYFTRQLIHDLYYDVELCVYPRLRDQEGLLLSSKNSLLRSDEKAQLINIYKLLKKAEGAVGKGLVSCKKLKWYIENDLNDLYLCHLQVTDIVEVQRLRSIETIVDEAYIMIAVRVGKLRVLDYIKVSVD